MQTASNFVQAHASNVQYAHVQHLEWEAAKAYKDVFAELHTLENAVQDKTCFPVICYAVDNKFVAWYDIELGSGYVA